MTLPQDIRPIFQNIQDTLARSDLPWIERTPKSLTKVLWVGRESGSWAALNLWKAGFVLSPHKHLAGAHLFVVSGRLQVRGGGYLARTTTATSPQAFCMRRLPLSRILCSSQ